MIKKDILAQIILDFQKDNLPKTISREVDVSLDIPLKRALAILGPRRSGKTFFLFSLIEKLLQKGIEKKRILYVNFEQPRLIGMTPRDLSVLLEVFYEIFPENKKKKVWLFFDEIQNIKNWEIFIRSVIDQEKAQVFLSGSSSKLLSKEITTSMRGRALSYLILPFSFKEILDFKGVVYEKYLSSTQQASILNSFSDFFKYGSYPETVVYPKERERIIQEIIEVTIHQDLIERHKLRNIKLVKLMFNYLIQAKEFSVHQFYNFLKSINLKVSKNTLYNYLDFFGDAFIFFPLKRFSWSLKNVEQSASKIYAIDNGLIQAIVGENKSKKFENLSFLSLLRKGYAPNKDLFYYALSSKAGEVDFIVKKGKVITSLIQACFDLSDYSTKEREIKSLLKASEELKCNDLSIITWDEEREEKIKGKKIKIIPLWKWLLIK
ncbi:MAG: ATP-binding protein [bacterium]|nr:ATP-binding protein [bacterium]